MQALLDRLPRSLAASRSPQGRRQLLATGELGELASLAAAALAHRGAAPGGCADEAATDEQLVLLLRTLRNGCAEGNEAARTLLQHGLHERTAALAATLAAAAAAAAAAPRSGGVEGGEQQQPGERQERALLLLTAVQLLVNMAVASADGARAVWAELFPDKLQAILAAPQAGVHEAAALAMLTCARASGDALEDLTSPESGSAWLQLLAPLLALPGGGGSGGGASGGPAVAGAAAKGNSVSTGEGAASNDNLCLLLQTVALRCDRLQQLFEALDVGTADARSCPSSDTGSTPAADASAAPSHSGSGGSHSSAPATAGEAQQQASPLAKLVSGGGRALELRPNLAHAVLLHILALEATAVPSAAAQEEAPCGASRAATAAAGEAAQGGAAAAGEQQLRGASTAWPGYLVALLGALHAQATSGGGSTVAAYALEALLQLLKAVVSRDDGGRALLQRAHGTTHAAGAGASCDCVQLLHADGLVQQLLAMLQALGPPPKPRHQQQQAREPEQRPPSLSPPPSQQQQQQQRPPPYGGYRTDIVAVLSNLLFERRPVQDEVLASGGVELLLSNTNLDESAPLAREWALWSVRNICAGNEAAQRYISGFGAVEPVQSSELERMGMELQLDRATQKMRLIEKPRQPQGAQTREQLGRQ